MRTVPTAVTEETMSELRIHAQYCEYLLSVPRAM